MVKFLLENGAEINTDRMMSYMYPTLAVAAYFGSTEIMGLLLARCKTTANSLALHRAAAAGRLDMVQYLVDHGADVNEVPPDNHILTWSVRDELGPPLHFAVRRRHLPVVKYLLDHGADATLCDIDGRDLVESARGGDRGE